MGWTTYQHSGAYCMLRQKQWLENEEERTIRKNIDLVERNLTGAARKGVKFEPYWDFIPIENYAVPLLHIMIGVFNDVIDHFVDKVDSRFNQHSAAELEAVRELADLKHRLTVLCPEVASWQKSK